METNNNQKQKDIDIRKITAPILEKKKTLLKIWVITFILSCIWIFPQPRYYTCEVKLAPEWGDNTSTSEIGSMAASFGFDLSSMQSSDAIYPMLYPELFDSPEFLVPLFDVRVKSLDGEIDTSYHDYLSNNQKKNPLLSPLAKVSNFIKSFFEEKKTGSQVGDGTVNPFRLSKKDFELMGAIRSKVKCVVDKKNNVVSIIVKDQDALICATLADSVRAHLQDFIINYRTSKARLDVSYYQTLRDSALIEYKQATEEYSRYCDNHQNVILQANISKRDQLENDMALKLSKYQTVSGQLEKAKAKVQEQTPAFTVIKSPSVPIRPAGPKRMMFVALMVILAMLGSTVWCLRRLIISELI